MLEIWHSLSHSPRKQLYIQAGISAHVQAAGTPASDCFALPPFLWVAPAGTPTLPTRRAVYLAPATHTGSRAPRLSSCTPIGILQPHQFLAFGKHASSVVTRACRKTSRCSGCLGRAEHQAGCPAVPRHIHNPVQIFTHTSGSRAENSPSWESSWAVQTSRIL